MSKALVGVVLINWNCGEYTENCIASLLSGSRVPDLIVVVDNASSDGSPTRIKETYPSVQLIVNAANYGFTGANNIGISYLLERGVTYIWILNNDTTVSTNCLEILLDSLETNENAAAATCKIYWHDSKVIWFAGSLFDKITYRVRHRGEGETDYGQYDCAESLDFLDGCCILVRGEILRDIGLFDEHFFAYHEDLDLSFRIRNSGSQLFYVSGGSINHFAGASVKSNKRNCEVTSSPLQHFLSRRNKLFIVRRYGKIHNVLFCLMLLTINGIYITTAMILLGRFNKARAVWSGIFHGLLDDISMIKTSVDVTPYK